MVISLEVFELGKYAADDLIYFIPKLLALESLKAKSATTHRNVGWWRMDVEQLSF
ncbi:hypothetical protein [Microcoleus sp. bin38.metabat.b11b12b14.051]|uniref:hypothetical protein n=1 Tax=Microcoleus sp. bin38.metabat.b11b12b14.051 TaxID=2742709 RepID=UPI0025D0D83C|nr:hypothetical protein [Microcoleus sp. bin38.metabat.b11b12b14.051]